MKLLVRYKQYLDMTCKGIIKPSTMAPTERTAFYHGLSIHLQIITWKVLDNTEIELMPDEWGWYWKGNQLFPIMTNLDVAPESLLKVIRCRCKSTSQNQCGTNLCSCRKHGLKCVSTCGECFGESCENKEVR